MEASKKTLAQSTAIAGLFVLFSKYSYLIVSLI